MRLWFFILSVVLLFGACAGPQSGLVLENMQRDIRPQDDLYGFANGAWMAQTEIPADKSNYGTFTVLADKARVDVRAIVEETVLRGDGTDSNERLVSALYQSVMNVERLEELGNAPLEPHLHEISAIAHRRGLAVWLGETRRLGLWGPVGVYISYDAKNPRRYLAHVTQAGLDLPDRDYYLVEGEREEAIRAQYKAHMVRMLLLSGAFADESAAQASADAAYEIERALAEGHWTRVERRNREKRYNPTTRSALEGRQGGFPWGDFLKASGLGEQDELIVGEPSYLETFERVFRESPLEDWKNYCRWKVVHAAGPLMHKALDEEHFDFYQRTLAGTPEPKPRWERAVGAVNRMIGEAVGQLYVARHFKPEAKERMNALVEQLRAAYGDALSELEWLGDETRVKALEKLQKFRPKIGYPDVWKDYSALDLRGDDLLGNHQRYAAWDWDRDVSRLAGPVDREEWFMNPQTVNAYYNPPMNEIVFPAAILQPPFFNLEADEAVNYGAIGAVIGHEMGHGFDDQGAKSDGDGVLVNWWTEEDLKEFKGRTAKLVDQANHYTVLDDQHLNGAFTLGENIGDLGGLTIAVRAWRRSLGGAPSPVIDGFTGIQRVFLGWAQVWARKYRDEELRRRLLMDPHAPSEFRANGPVRNIPDFVEAFGVKEGDKLYLSPDERVKIW